MRELTSDERILEWISGYKIPFAYKVVQRTPPSEQSLSDAEKSIMSIEIDFLLGKGAIEKCKPHPKQFLSWLFIISRSDGSDRLILNLRSLNSFIQTVYFKLEDGRTVRQILIPDSFMAR